MAIKTLKLPFGQIKGLMQGIDESMLSFSYSPDCQNVDVSDGIIKTRKGLSTVCSSPADLLLRCIYPISETEIIGGFEVTAGGLLVLNAYSWKVYTRGNWYQITTDGTTPAIPQYRPQAAKFMHYKKDGNDIILGVFGIYTPSGGGTSTSPASLVKIYKHDTNDYRLVDLTSTVSAPSGAYYITLHRERVWLNLGDSVAYSNAYDPEDWSTSGQTGSIEVYTQDNSPIVSIANFMDDVVIFKTNTIHLVLGDTPGEYDIAQSYAEQGTLHRESVCSDGNNCFFAGNDGIYRYMGTETAPLLTDEIKTIFASMQSIKSLVNNNKLYVFDTLGTTHLVYDIRQKRIEVLSGFSVKDAYVYGNTVYVADSNGVAKLVDTALKDQTENIAAYWNSPDSSLGYPNAEKTLTDLYFTAWGTKNDGTAGGQVKITVYYNKNGTVKTKEKTITLQTTRKPHAVRYNLTGRLFKFKIENVDGSAINIADIYAMFELSED